MKNPNPPKFAMYNDWLNSEKYNCGNPECEACNAAMGKPVQLKAKLNTKGVFGKEYSEEFVANLEYTAGRSVRATVSENGTVDILAKVETLFGDVSVSSTVSATSTVGDVESKILSALLGAIRNKKDFKIRTV